MGRRRDRERVDLSSTSTTVSEQAESRRAPAPHPPGGVTGLVDRLRAAGPQRIALWCAWIAFPLAGMVWVASQYGENWFYYDEWTTIDRSFGSWTQMFSGHQGHLEVFSYIFYRVQRTWFGLEGHHVVWLAFMASIAAFHVSVAAVLTRLRVPVLLSLLAATIVTYFGIGGQSVTWEFQLGINLALAACLFAAYFALGKEYSRRDAIIVAALLVFAFAADSGLAVIGSIFVGIVLLMLWPWRIGIPALAPAALGHLAWFAFGDQGVHYGTTFDRVWDAGTHLFLLAAGGLVGGGETESIIERAQGGVVHPDPVLPLSGIRVGELVLVLSAGCIAYAIARRRLDRALTAALIGGLVAALAATASIAESRAFYKNLIELLPGNRYVQWVAVFLLVALAPVVVAVLRSSDARRNRIVGGIAGIVLVAVLAISADMLGPVAQSGQEWAAQVKLHVAEALTVVEGGCPPGRRLDPDAEPIPDLAPQVTVDVLQRVLADGALPADFAVPPPAQMRRVMCPVER